MLEISHVHPGNGEPVQIQQAVPLARVRPFVLRIGGSTELVCWGVMPSGMLRHPLFSRW